MEQNEMAVTSKAKKATAKKTSVDKFVEKEAAPMVIEAYGLKLTLDNSIKKYANNPFSLKKLEEARIKFSQNKSEI